MTERPWDQLSPETQESFATFMQEVKQDAAKVRPMTAPQGDWFCRECARIVPVDQVEAGKHHAGCGGRVEPHPTTAFTTTALSSLEAAARALCRSRGLEPDCLHQGDEFPLDETLWNGKPAYRGWRKWETHARAAIRAYLLAEAAHYGANSAYLGGSGFYGACWTSLPGPFLEKLAADLRPPAETAGEQEGD